MAKTGVSLLGAKYVGGFTARPCGGKLVFSDEKIEIPKGLLSKGMWIKTPAVTKVVLGSQAGDVHTLTKGYTVGGGDEATLEVHTQSGGCGYFTVSDSPIKVKAALASWLASHNIELVAAA